MTRGSAAGGADRADGIAGHRAAVTWSLFVAGIPKSTRPGTLVISRTTGRPFVRKRNTGWANRIAAAAQSFRPRSLLEGPLFVTLRFQLQKPVSGKAAKRQYPEVRPDVERLGSGVLDSLQGLVYRDDAQICSLVLIKAYDKAPGVEITVEELT